MPKQNSRLATRRNALNRHLIVSCPEKVPTHLKDAVLVVLTDGPVHERRHCGRYLAPDLRHEMAVLGEGEPGAGVA